MSFRMLFHLQAMGMGKRSMTKPRVFKKYNKARAIMGKRSGPTFPTFEDEAIRGWIELCRRIHCM